MQIVLAHGKNWLAVIHRELMFRFNKILFEDSTKIPNLKGFLYPFSYKYQYTSNIQVFMINFS